MWLSGSLLLIDIVITWSRRLIMRSVRWLREIGIGMAQLLLREFRIIHI